MASQGSSDKSFAKASVIRSHYIYKSIWTPVVEELALQREHGNDHDKSAGTPLCTEKQARAAVYILTGLTKFTMF